MKFPDREKGMVTLKEIAQSLGVSPSTVSIVLKGDAERRKVAPATKERVLKAAEELGYQPNLEARRLRSFQERNLEEPLKVAVFWEEPLRETILVRFLQGFQARVREKNYNMMPNIYFYKYGSLSERAALFRDNLFHAVILYGMMDSDAEFLLQSGFQGPVIDVNARYDQNGAARRFHTFRSDSDDLSDKTMKSFRDNGGRMVSLCQSGAFMDIAQFRRYAELYGLGIFDTNEFSKGSIEGGYQWAMRHIDPDPEKRKFDCLICGSERMAFGVVQALKDMNISVPGEMRIIALDVYNLNFQEFCSPSLSTISIPIEEEARRCCDLLHRISSGELRPTEPIEELVMASYDARESCPAAD